MNLENFRHSDWTKIWSGTWSFLSCSHFGVEYTKLIKFGDQPFVSQSIIVVSEGKSSGWIRQSDRDILGKYLASEITKNPELVIEVCNKLKSGTDQILNFIENQFKNIIFPPQAKVDLPQRHGQTT